MPRLDIADQVVCNHKIGQKKYNKEQNNILSAIASTKSKEPQAHAPS